MTKQINCIFALILVGMISTVGVEPSSAAPKYNLLIIQTDEHNFRTLGCYGGTTVKTPHIDWLAEHGAKCTSFYATTPVCSPSRASLLTGLYPQKTPVVNNNIPMSDKVTTFAQILQRQGYSTGYAGKWHLDGSAKPGWAPKRKFGFDDNRYMFNRGHWKKFEITAKGPRVAARKNGKPTYGVDGADEQSFATDWLTDRTIDFIRTNKDKPFCYMLSIPDPHGPNTVRAPYDTMFANTKVPIPPTLTKKLEQTPAWARITNKLSPKIIARIMGPYYGMVKCIDDNLGRIYAELRKQGLMERTIIVFTSDHGDLCGEHGRLNKGIPYEASARIPFLIYAPGKVKGGVVIDEALSCVDFLPTVMTLMEVKHDVKVDGRDFTQLLTGEKQGKPWTDVAFLRGTGEGSWICAATDDHKLVFAPNEKPWLFDVTKDPKELNNYFDDPAYADAVKRLAAALAHYGQQHNDPSYHKEAIQQAVQKAVGN